MRALCGNERGEGTGGEMEGLRLAPVANKQVEHA